LLKYHTDARLMPIAKDNFARGGFQEAGEDAQQCALTAAGGSQHANKFLGADLEGEMLERAQAAIIIRKYGGQIVNGKNRRNIAQAFNPYGMN
jgi:hypothetical protein